MDEKETKLTPELIEFLQKVGGQETGRLAVMELFGPPKVDVVALTLMQKNAAALEANPTLFNAVSVVDGGLALFDTLHGEYKLAGVADRAKGFKRVGELLTGSRAKTLEAAKDHASGQAAEHLIGAVRNKPNPAHTEETMKFIHGHGGFGSYHAPQSKTPPKEIAETYRHARHVHHNKLESTRAERLGKVLGAEKAKVRTTRAGAGAIGTGAVVGGAVALKKSKKNDQ